MSTIPELGPSEFRKRWPGFPDDSVTLLDVREHHEIAVASVPGTLHIPMGEIPQRIGELDPDRIWVVMCHVGGRSRRTAEFMRASGFERVFNLTGGIDAWSIELDPTIPRY